jgi:hypothetical protein
MSVPVNYLFIFHCLDNITLHKAGLFCRGPIIYNAYFSAVKSGSGCKLGRSEIWKRGKRRAKRPAAD